MRKILFLTWSLLSTVCFGQEAASDSLSALRSDSAALASETFSTENAGEVGKAEADSAYMKNDYTSAIQIYETLLNKGEAAEIYYNLGNCYFKTGDIAKAILNYERALLLQPGNSDIRANLEIARSKTIDKVEPAPEIFFVTWANDLANSMSERAWSILSIAFFLSFIAALYFFIFSRQVVVKKMGFFAGLVCFVLVILANVFAAQQKNKLIQRDKAIIMNPSVTVHSTPSEGGTELFVLHEGSKVRIKDNSMKEWKEIQLEDGKVGWVPAVTIEVI